MNKLKVELKNCYGIQCLEEEFDFSASKGKAYAIYAPNGLMKTSFSKTFENLAKGQKSTSVLIALQSQTYLLTLQTKADTMNFSSI